MSGTAPTFTVVIPTHQGRSTIRHSVASVLEQAYPDLELLVSCDGESSRTRACLAGIDDPRMKIIEQEHKGVSAARNHGAMEGSAPWLVFLDDDDTMRPDALSHWADRLYPNVGVACGMLAFHTNGRFTHQRDSHLDLNDQTMDASRILPGGFIVSKTLFDEVGGYDESLTYSENQDLGFRLIDHIRSEHEPRLVVNSDHVMTDFDREQSTTRILRYRSAPARSARIFLDRYQTRLQYDRRTAAALHRILARAARHEGYPLRAVRMSVRALLISPRGRGNLRSVLIALGNLLLPQTILRVLKRSHEPREQTP